MHKYYKITKKGLKVLAETKEEWQAYTMAVGKVIDVNPASVFA